MTNILRHAQATKVNILIEERRGRVCSLKSKTMGEALRKAKNWGHGLWVCWACASALIR